MVDLHHNQAVIKEDNPGNMTHFFKEEMKDIFMSARGLNWPMREIMITDMGEFKLSIQKQK